jgi:hypothetical protein
MITRKSKAERDDQNLVIRSMIDYLDEQPLNDRDTKWFMIMRNSFEDLHFLTERQYEVLESIYERY